MISWIDIACIVFVCVTANHLGLVSAIESVLKVRLPIVNCVKCLTFWATVAYGLICAGSAACGEMVTVLAISFLASYMAIWLELFEGYVDSLYVRMYEKIYGTDSDDATASDPNNGHPAGSVS